MMGKITVTELPHVDEPYELIEGEALVDVWLLLGLMVALYDDVSQVEGSKPSGGG